MFFTNNGNTNNNGKSFEYKLIINKGLVIR